MICQTPDCQTIINKICNICNTNEDSLQHICHLTCFNMDEVYGKTFESLIKGIKKYMGISCTLAQLADIFLPSNQYLPATDHKLIHLKGFVTTASTARCKKSLQINNSESRFVCALFLKKLIKQFHSLIWITRCDNIHNKHTCNIPSNVNNNQANQNLTSISSPTYQHNPLYEASEKLGLAVRNTMEYITDCFTQIRPKHTWRASLWKNAHRIMKGGKEQIMIQKSIQEEQRVERLYEIERQLDISPQFPFFT